MNFGLFNYVDLFRLPNLLYFDGHTKRTSWVGISSSLAIYIFLFYTFLQSDLFEKKAPYVVLQSNQISHSQRVNINENFLIAISVRDSTGQRYFDETYFSITFKYSTSAIESEYKTLVPCTLEDAQNNMTLYVLLGMENSYCLKNKTFSLEGFWNEEMINFVTISISQCENETSEVKCQSPERIEQFFKDKFIGIIYSDTQIDLYDYKKPFKTSYKTDYVAIDSSLQKNLNFFFKTAQMSTDDGTILPDVKTSFAIMFNRKEYDVIMRKSIGYPFVNMYLYASKEEVKCSRRYQKLPDVLGSLAGIAHLIMFFCMLVSSLIVYISTLEFVVNRLYIFPEISKKHKKIYKRSKLKLLNPKPILEISKSSCTVYEDSFNKSIIPNILMPPNLREKQHTPSLIYQEDKDNTLSPPKIKEKSTLPSLILHDESDLTKKEELSAFNFNEILSKKDDSFNENVLKTTIKQFDSAADEILTSPDKRSPEMKPKKSLSMKPSTFNNYKIHIPPKRKESRLSNLKIQINHKIDKIKSLMHRKPSIFQTFFSMQDQKNTLKLSIFEYLFYLFSMLFCFKKSCKQQLISKAEKAFRQDLDIVSIIEKIHDIEKLKILLLNEDQLSLFNYLSKPMIAPNDMEESPTAQKLSKSHLKMAGLMNISQKQLNVEEIYKRVIHKKDEDKVNSRLIDLFDQRVAFSWKCHNSLSNQI